jgi:hypothetical protein
MDIGALVTTFFNNAGPGGAVVLLIFGTAGTVYFLLTRWIVTGGRKDETAPVQDEILNGEI